MEQTELDAKIENIERLFLSIIRELQAIRKDGRSTKNGKAIDRCCSVNIKETLDAFGNVKEMMKLVAQLWEANHD